MRSPLIKSLSLILSSFFISYIAFGQDGFLKIHSVSELVLDKRILDYNESEYLFKSDPMSHEYYLKSKKKLNASKVMGYSTLGVLGGSIIAIAVDNHTGYCDLICLTTGDVIGILGIGLVMPLIGTPAIIIHFSGKKHQKKAVGAYNANLLKSKSQSHNMNIKIGATHHGLGLVLSF